MSGYPSNLLNGVNHMLPKVEKLVKKTAEYELKFDNGLGRRGWLVIEPKVRRKSHG
jgi:hypothetical protein